MSALTHMPPRRSIFLLQREIEGRAALQALRTPLPRPTVTPADDTYMEYEEDCS